MRFRKLFLKIFIWFWLATAAIIGALWLVARVSEAENQPERASRGAFSEALSLYAESAVRSYETEGPRALEQFISRSLQESGTEVYLFEGNGRPLIGLDPQKDNVISVMQEVRDSAPNQRVSRPFEGRTTWGKPVVSAGNNRYIFVARLRQPGLRLPLFPPSRIAVIILTAGLVCYLLALYLTSPVKKLQSIVQAFAEGNLDARVSPGLGMRGDELADLGWDFDRMADRISTLISSQKRLLADISHELRSPLARLSVALELARKNGTAASAPALNRIEREAERLNELVGQLLALTRLESGAERVPAEMVTLEDLIQQIVEDANFEARPLRKEVRIVQLEKCRIRGSDELLRSATENVVRNAVRYTPEGTTVEVELRWKLDTAWLSVRDRGPGVPEDELGHIFEPFYRVSAARDRASGGAGLGLSIAERTVKLHGGSIRAENAGPGLLVTILLPLAPSENSERAHPPVPATSAVS
ncbi:MAG TPA: ATP-binding protein [Candidatus Saccharimonadales bacterium]|jgi:signal transduction histidine kinase|nr:ATP-binding protein [Candidatus Saccharimonadales bacterium]